MPLHSDLTIDASKFKPDAVSEPTRQMNEALMQLTKGDPGWWEVCFSFLILAKIKINECADRRSEVQRNEKDREDRSAKTRFSRVRRNILGILEE